VSGAQEQRWNAVKKWFARQFADGCDTFWSFFESK